ncbi:MULTISPECIES: DNA translocase FtsK [unclassified Spiroplasma]|uniref:DNA translocase FtsK n=1 Tax=unclassified Spiroplasma TaxID=2637901 RepID=UPI0030CB84CC
MKKQEENEKYALENKEKINQLFKEFSVQGKVNDFTIGTTVTKYEVSITSGMKINKITNLEEELKLVLANNNIRIEAPIAGKSMIGIEVSNKNIVPINMQEQFENISEKYKNKKLLISIGRNTTGDYIFHSLKEMPHLLIAGSTGSGKSVFINDLLIFLLLQYKPHEIKLILIDPKWVELAIYNDIPHLIIPVIKEANKTPAALQVVILEMMRRYQLFAKNGNRDIESYNKKISQEIDKLPYYIIVIDELADLMVQASKQIEKGIMRITQMGRAAGIHLVIATQRPSVDVITGVIKNNIPARIAFKVASWIDSKTILDTAGAEKLLGKGDMLFLAPGQNNINRLQAPWISDEDVSKLIKFIKEQSSVKYDNNFIEKIKEIKDSKK